MKLLKFFSLSATAATLCLTSLEAMPQPMNAYPPQTPMTCCDPEPYTPWRVGSLLAFPGHTLPKGDINLKPYLFATRIAKQYNKEWHSFSIPTVWSISPLLFAEFGVTDWFQIDLIPQMSINHTKGATATGFNDLPLLLDFQLYNDSPDEWYPAVRFGIREIFPTGKYQRGHADKKAMDLMGLGSFTTQLDLNFEHLYELSCPYYLWVRLNTAYGFPTPVHVHGSNSYGGGPGTSGRVRPGQYFYTILGLEFSVAQRWVIDIDFEYLHRNKDHFSGTPGILVPEVPAANGLPGTPAVLAVNARDSGEQFSIAPSLEYMWRENVGVQLGVWTTVAGRNTANFTSYVFAFNYYIPAPKKCCP